MKLKNINTETNIEKVKNKTNIYQNENKVQNYENRARGPNCITEKYLQNHKHNTVAKRKNDGTR